jgi:hypothetical protein
VHTGSSCAKIVWTEEHHMRSSNSSELGISWIPAVRSEGRRQEQENTSELLLTELRRGLALVSGTFTNDQSHARAFFEAARICEGVSELISDSMLDDLQRARIERGLAVLSTTIAKTCDPKSRHWPQTN